MDIIQLKLHPSTSQELVLYSFYTGWNKHKFNLKMAPIQQNQEQMILIVL